MIVHIWSVLCERISIDRDTNLVSYLTCIEEITVARLPFICPLLAFGSLWQTNRPSKDVLKFRLLLISPEGSEKVLIESEDYVFEKERHRTNIILNGIPFEHPGTYLFRIQKKQAKEWEMMAEIPMKIILLPDSAKPTTIAKTR